MGLVRSAAQEWRADSLHYLLVATERNPGYEILYEAGSLQHNYGLFWIFKGKSVASFEGLENLT